MSKICYNIINSINTIYMSDNGNWIQGMHMKKGALHESLNVPEGKKIPKAKIEKAAHSKNPTLARRGKLAETLAKLRGNK